MTYCFDDPSAPSRRTTQYYEMLGHRAIYHDGWKAVTLHFPRTPYAEERWSLFHVAEDFAEIHDLADQLPEKVAELEAMWWSEAAKYDVLPLDDRTIELFTLRRPGSELARDTFTLRLGTARIDRFAVPDVRNRSWSVTAQVGLVEGAVPTGVLVSVGGRTGGYSLYVQDGAAHFAFNRLADIVTTSAPLPLDPSGDSIEITVRFTKTGEFAGTLDVLVDGSVGATGSLATLPFRQTLFGLHVGADHGSTVTDAYDAPFAFTGRDLIVRYHLHDDQVVARSAAAMEAKAATAEQ
jgi:arylsulfatase